MIGPRFWFYGLAFAVLVVLVVLVPFVIFTFSSGRVNKTAARHRKWSFTTKSPMHVGEEGGADARKKQTATKIDLVCFQE